MHLTGMETTSGGGITRAVEPFARSFCIVLCCSPNDITPQNQAVGVVLAVFTVTVVVGIPCFTIQERNGGSCVCWCICYNCTEIFYGGGGGLSFIPWDLYQGVGNAPTGCGQTECVGKIFRLKLDYRYAL